MDRILDGKFQIHFHSLFIFQLDWTENGKKVVRQL